MSPRSIVDEYILSLNIHGLTRSLKGRRGETAFWKITLLIGMAIIIVTISGLVNKYFRYEIYTEMKSVAITETDFPSVVFCERTLLQQAYFSYCGQFIYHHAAHQNDEYCASNHDDMVGNEAGNKHTNWSHTPFRIKACMSLGGEVCKKDAYLKPYSKLNNSCIVWNYNGDFQDPYGQVMIVFEFHKPDELKEKVQMFAIPRDPGIHDIDIRKKLGLDPNHRYEIIIDKTFIKRLPPPFPTKCTNDKKLHIFDGGYTRSLCIESHYYIDMYKTCGDVFDFHRKYIPGHVKKAYKRNRTGIRACLRTFSHTQVADIEQCQLACEMLDINYIWTFQKHYGERRDLGRVTRYEVILQLKSPKEYKIMEEKRLYTLSQMLCEIGGFVGLIMGMSVISVIEVLVLTVLYIVERISCFTGKY